MTPFQLANALLEANYKYATTDISPSPEFGDFIIRWGDLNIPEHDLYVEEDGGCGREKEIHVTVKYGLLAKDVPEELREIAQTTKPFAVDLLNISLFTTNPKFDVVKLGVDSPPLMELNKRITEAVPHEDTYPEYKPHLTIAYVQKGTCDHLVDDDPFKDGTPRGFMVSGMRFKGAGESGDPERVEELLLFSKGPRHDVALESFGEPKMRTEESAVYATTLVEQWRRLGLTTEQMERKLRLGEWGRGMKYWHNRRQFPQAFNRFVEQATDCIAQLRETRFSQAVIDVDPFASCAFPVDPDRTRQFLRNSGKRRGERSIL